MAQSHDETLIIGGGIGGLSAALALDGGGIRVRLVEQATKFSEVGAGLQIGPNATRSLDRLGVWDRLKPLAVHPRAGVVRNAVTGEHLTSIDFGEPFLKRYGYPYIVAHRADILNVLLEECQSRTGITLETRKRVTSVSENPDHAVVAFEDGEVVNSRVVIGADGIRSQVRRLHDESEPKFTGHVAYRGALPIEQITSDVEHDDIVLWIGPKLHLIQYPVRSGRLYNQVAVFESDWYVEGRDDWGERAELEHVFRDACAPVQAGLSQMTDQRKWPIFDRDPLESWTTSHTVLLGDAAHAMRQYLGQGACQAVEDALVLAKSISGYPGDASLAFRRYQDRRIEHTTRCQLAARPWGDLWHTDKPTVVALRDRYFRQRAHDDYSELDWLYADHLNDLDGADHATLSTVAK